MTVFVDKNCIKSATLLKTLSFEETISIIFVFCWSFLLELVFSAGGVKKSVIQSPQKSDIILIYLVTYLDIPHIQTRMGIILIFHFNLKVFKRTDMSQFLTSICWTNVKLVWLFCPKLTPSGSNHKYLGTYKSFDGVTCDCK